MTNVIDPGRAYDYLCRARERVLGWVRPLSREQYRREFQVGAGSLAKIFNHVLIAEWYYVLRMQERDVPPLEQILERDRNTPDFPALESAWAEQREQTRACLASDLDWHKSIVYDVTDDETGRLRRVRTTAADIATQLLFHEIHHRSQALNILRRLGVETEDIDYGLTMYEIEAL